MKLVVDVEHPKAGVQRQLAAAIRMTDTPARIDRPSPLLGQHTEEVLLEFGWMQRGRRPGGERRGPGRTARLILAAERPVVHASERLTAPRIQYYYAE